MSSLLDTLMSSMTDTSSVNALAKRSGGSSDQVSGLLSLAMPMLMQSLTNNASTQEGASSLLGALGQHTSTAPIASQIEEADEDDGSAIIGHIFGGNQINVISQLTQQSGMQSNQVSSVLYSLAPALLSGLSGATASASASAQSSSSSSGGLGLLGLLFGRRKKKESAAGDLLSLLLAAMK